MRFPAGRAVAFKLDSVKNPGHVCVTPNFPYEQIVGLVIPVTNRESSIGVTKSQLVEIEDIWRGFVISDEVDRSSVLNVKLRQPLTGIPVKAQNCLVSRRPVRIPVQGYSREAATSFYNRIVEVGGYLELIYSCSVADNNFFGNAK